VISQIDEALRTLVRAEALDGASDVEVVLDAPTKDWAARRNAPTVNLYLYDIREDLRRREVGVRDRLGPDGAVLGRIPAPRYFKLSYLVTAWTQRPEDEHRLLAALLNCLLRYDALPPHVVPGVLTDNGLVAPLTIGLPPPEDRAFADVWTALGGELKPSIDLVVIVPMAAGLEEAAGPPVREGLYVTLADRVDGGTDERRHQHQPPVPAAAASSGAATSATSTASGGRRARARKRAGG
jgi:hypothetical protein